MISKKKGQEKKKERKVSGTDNQRSKMTPVSDSIYLKLNRAQSIVLFEWLTKQEELDNFKFEHESEQRLLWYLQLQLERQEHILAAILNNPDYLAILTAARDEIAADQRSVDAW